MKVSKKSVPPLVVSLIPIVVLFGVFGAIIATDGAEAVQDSSSVILLATALVSALLSRIFTVRRGRHLWLGLCKSARQVLPAIPVLFFIGALSATWMYSGVVPALIDYGLGWLDPSWFLPLACVICALISIVTGSSWTTIATIGVAFMGIGTVLGYNPAWVAGAIISGAYFGDKVSPLSDTTVVASSTCGVDLFTHIRYMLITTIPAMVIALAVYTFVGFSTPTITVEESGRMADALATTFNITPWVLLIPAITLALIAFRVRSELTLMISSLLGFAGIFIFQPHLVEAIGGSGRPFDAVRVIFTETSIATGDPLLDSLVETGGVEGMLPTIFLVLSAMVFGGMLIGSGMLSSITGAITSRLRKARNVVGTTVFTGLFLSAVTGDQYLSLILGGNIYKATYRRSGLRPQLLSRTLEDSISVTSVLIPWNSCGVTQASVLGVATLAYLPFCIFNLASPVMSVVVASIGWKIHEHRSHAVSTATVTA